MATQSDLPFKLTFHQYQDKPITKFNLDEKEAMKVAERVLEYHKFSLTFECSDPNARLYMDGLELITAPNILTDDKRVPYVQPSTERVWIYRGSTSDDYPLIPSYYSLRIIAGNETYEALYFVQPKDMSFNEWETMRSEIEDVMTGLAGDFIRKRLNIGSKTQNNLPPEQYYRYTIIEQHFPKVMLAINDLITKANFRVRKDYRLLPIDRAKEIDEKSVRFRLQNPDKEHTLKTPVRDVEYNLPENQWVLRILKMVHRYLEEIIHSLEELLEYELNTVYKDRNNQPRGALHRERENASNYLSTLLQNARKFKNSFQIIKSAFWYNCVTEGEFSQFPPSMMYDPRYRIFYQLYRQLRSNDKKIDIDTEYTYQWKRTDLLYEIWGYLQICNALIGTGYQPLSGWLYDQKPIGSKLFIPVLKSGTVIALQKERVRLNLVYDQVIKRTAYETEDDLLTIFTDYHNKPDTRMDVFVDDLYYGSVVIDFKYRKRGKFWDLENPHKTSTNQLLHYHTNITTQHLDGVPPVPEVWAVYPGYYQSDSSETIDYNRQHRVRFVKLRPGKENDHLSNMLETVIESTVNRLGRIAKQLGRFVNQ